MVRVFLRAGLAEQDEPAHMIAVARETHANRPGALDFPAWLIGRQWCRPREPLCDECALAAVCARLIQRGSDVQGM
jgi:endonuclease-3